MDDQRYPQRTGRRMCRGLLALSLFAVNACGGESGATDSRATTEAGDEPRGNSEPSPVGDGSSGEITGAQDSGTATTSEPESTAGDVTTVGPPESGEVRSPDLPIEGAPALTILGSTLGRNPGGQIRWLFTFRNDSDEPFCGYTFNAKLLDSAGTLVAGAHVTSEEYARGVPAFGGTMMGSVYRGFRQDGVMFLDACVPPGGRGLAAADVWTATTFRLPEEEVALILDSAARLQHDLTPFTPSLEDLELAPDLPQVSDLRLVDTPDGKVVRGVAVSSVNLAHWRAWIVLFDANGVIVDLVPAPQKLILDIPRDTPMEFSSAPVVASATQLEVFFESSRLRY